MPGELPRTPARGSQWQSCRRRARCIRRSTAPSCEIAGADEESASSRWIEKPRYCVRSGVGLALETSAVSERRAEKTVRSNDTRVSTTSPELQEIRVLSPARRDPFDGWGNGAGDVAIGRFKRTVALQSSDRFSAADSQEWRDMHDPRRRLHAGQSGKNRKS